MISDVLGSAPGYDGSTICAVYATILEGVDLESSYNDGKQCIF